VGKQWNGLVRDVVESPSMEMFKTPGQPFLADPALSRGWIRQSLEIPFIFHYSVILCYSGTSTVLNDIEISVGYLHC